MENQKPIELLFQKYLNRQNSQDELTELLEYLGDLDDETFRRLLQNHTSEQPDAQLSAQSNRMLEQLDIAIYSELDNRRKKAPSISSLQKYAWIGVAAAIVTMILGVWFFMDMSDARRHVQDRVVYQNDIGPGKHGATLTLANGQVIRLNEVADGELARQGGAVISKTADGQLIYQTKESKGGPSPVNSIATEKGETYQLRLPDGSVIWLNSASSLTYSAGLIQDGKRKVRLTGEGYFEIARDQAHPFIVESGGQEVEVLGTHFNINAYPDEPAVKTTLLEGSVSVGTPGGRKAMIEPDQQAVQVAGEIKVVPVIAETYVDWKNGDINFRKEDLAAIMRKVSRWYNVEVEYRDVRPTSQTFTGYVSRTKNVSIVLEALSKISNLKFRIEGRKIIVFK